MRGTAYRHLLRPRRCAWLLWLALLLPLAQSAAAAHSVSHPQERAGQRQDETAAADGACALCLMGAAMSSGGAVASVPAWPAPSGAEALPAASAVPVAALTPHWAHLSRAPPSTPR